MPLPPASSTLARSAGYALLFLVIAVVCSLPRFGERENEHQPTRSDSDYYLDMAHVFVGSSDDFNRDWVVPASHHYNRPLLPFLSGQLAHRVLGDNFRAAFSIVNILAATLIASLLFHLIRQQRPAWTLAWMPPVLFLTGFPQVNWGYHLLSDTLGLATALAAACYAAWLVQRSGETIPTSSAGRYLHLVALLGVSSLAFLARETAWLAVITTGWIILTRRPNSRRHWVRDGSVLLALLLGVIPHGVYASFWGTSGVTLRTSLGTLLDLRYLVDIVVKTGVCFNLAWIPAVIAMAPPRRDRIPPFFAGWTLGGVMYMGAGYLHNSPDAIGYPLRLSYVLFLPVFFAVAACFEQRLPSARRWALATGFCVVQFATSLIGVFLDPGKSHFQTTDVMKALRGFFGI